MWTDSNEVQGCYSTQLSAGPNVNNYDTLAGLSGCTSAVPTPVLTPALLPKPEPAAQMDEPSGECSVLFCSATPPIATDHSTQLGAYRLHC
jgi:hypothetical protein